MAQRSSRPSEDEAASDAAFTYLIGLSGRGMVFRLGWLFRSAWSASNIHDPRKHFGPVKWVGENPDRLVAFSGVLPIFLGLAPYPDPLVE
jgi:hypothetical protein